MEVSNNERADMLTHIGPTRIAVSLHRLFLGGLLLSRARVRFAGLLIMRQFLELAQCL